MQDALESCSGEVTFVSVYFESVSYYEDGTAANTHLSWLEYTESAWSGY